MGDVKANTNKPPRSIGHTCLNQNQGKVKTNQLTVGQHDMFKTESRKLLYPVFVTSILQDGRFYIIIAPAMQHTVIQDSTLKPYKTFSSSFKPIEKHQKEMSTRSFA